MSHDHAERPVIHYFQDTLCGWCFGFAPVVLQLQQEWSNHIDVVVYSGGMITGDRVRALSEMADFIRDARLRVEETTGVSFGKAFLDGLLLREDILLDSEPPARALEAMRALNDSATLRFSHRLQSALYLDGMDLSSEQTYCTLATEHNVDPNSFIALMNSSEIADAVADEFDYVSSLGISGFPTLLLEMGDTVHVLSSGFAPYEHLDTMLRAVFDV